MSRNGSINQNIFKVRVDFVNDSIALWDAVFTFLKCWGKKWYSVFFQLSEKKSGQQIGSGVTARRVREAWAARGLGRDEKRPNVKRIQLFCLFSAVMINILAYEVLGVCLEWKKKNWSSKKFVRLVKGGYSASLPPIDFRNSLKNGKTVKPMFYPLKLFKKSQNIFVEWGGGIQP